MKLKTLMAVGVAAAFALPFAAQVSAAGDSIILAQASGASSVGTGPTGGTPSTQSAGEPKAPTADSKADTRRCEPMTGAEREKCMREARAPGGSAAGGATTSSGSGTTGTTAGPGEASNRTAPGSATATKPDTSGQGKAQ